MQGPLLVTGAAGFAGSHLLDRLRHDGLRVEGWIRPGAPVPDAAHPALTWRAVDVLARDEIEAALSALAPRTIFHCAGAAHVARSWQAIARTLQTNAIGTHYLLDAERRLGLGARILVPGSATVYAPAGTILSEDSPLGPDTPYAVSKLAQEQIAVAAAAEGQHVLVTRSFNHIGPRQAPDYAAASFARQIALAEAGRGPTVLRVGNLAPRRDMTDVRDTVNAYISLVEHGQPGRIYNVCSGRAPTIRDLLDGLLRRSTVPILVELDAALFRPHDNPVVLGDPGRLQADTGWAPRVPLEQTLDELIAYWRAVVRTG